MPSFFIRVLKGELRASIALGALLLVLVGWSLAANGDNAVKFDFGDNSGVAPGYISVSGSNYPTDASGLQFGWLDPVIIKSHGSAVADLRLRDSNVSIEPARFKIAGLTRTLYNAEIISGDLTDDLATRVTYAGQNYLIRSNPGEWNRLILSVAPVNGEIEIDFSRIGTAENLWGINVLTLTATDTALSKPVFEMSLQPSAHIVYPGGQAVYRVNISSPNSYASEVNLSITDLVPSITAQITPAGGLPPFAADIRLLTTTATPTTLYSFTMQAKGEDADALTINKQLTLTVTGSQSEAMQDPNSLSPEFPQSIQDQLDYLNLIPATLAEMKSAQAKIDLFQKLQDRKLINRSQMQDLNELALTDVMPAFGEYPASEDGFGAALLYLTKAGMISSVVDYAPPAGDDQKPPIGFWAKFFGSVSNPAR